MIEPIRIAVLGAGGRLGRAIVRETLNDARFLLTGGVVRADSDHVGSDLGELAGDGWLDLPVSVRLEDGVGGADVVIDASTPTAAMAAANRFAESGGPALVTGTTGFDAAQCAALREASAKLAILTARNFSLGIAAVEVLVRQAATMLPTKHWDVEIEETHHRMKRDAPSGTALMLGEIVACARGLTFDDVAEQDRHGMRRPGAIGLASTRGGGVIGEHAVRYLADMEEIAIMHRVYDRRVFAQGALAAAAWMAGREPGLYSMADVIAGKP